MQTTRLMNFHKPRSVVSSSHPRCRPPWLPAGAWLANLFAIASAPLVAQTVAPPEEEAVELSPFVVESGDTGWVATETLGGTRLRTDFKDVPNQLETFTKEFMEDLGVTSLDEALIYSANTENQYERSESPSNDGQFPAAAARMRGLGEATLSRNFFPTRSQPDNYNIDRATVASGPNAILFGLGSPAGILDGTPARALMRNRYGFTLQYDSEDSRRATVDANIVALPEKLAVRIMGLTKRTYTAKAPNYDNDDRIYGALTFKPFKNTTLIVQGEGVHRRWNRAMRTTPFDFVTPWLFADQIAGSGYSAPEPIYDNSSLAGIGSNRVFAQASENPIMIQGEGDALRSWRNSVVVRSPSSLPGVDPTFDAGANYTLTDPSIFPFDVNFLGYARENRLNAGNATVMLEQKLADNLFLELAYNSDRSDDLILAAGANPSGTNFKVLVDANQYIPGTTTPNPHVGEFYWQGIGASRLRYFDRSDWRSTLSYEYDAGRKLGERQPWMEWLGRHRLLGLYGYSLSEALNQNAQQRRILDDPVLPGVTLRPKTFQNWANHASRIPQYRHYLGDPYETTQAFGPLWGDDWTLHDANGDPFTLYSYSTPLVSVDGKPLSAQNAATGVRNKVNTMVFVWQGFFLPDRDNRERLVLTYGYRKDSARSAVLDQSSITQDFSGLYPSLWHVDYAPYGEKESGTNRNFGVVARPLPWLSLSYNKSTTFELATARYGPFGNQLPGVGGDGQDYGIRVDLWQNKLSLKVNKYETTLAPTPAIQQINNYLNIFGNIERRVVELDAGIPRNNVIDGTLRGFPVLSNSSYSINSDRSAKGYEVELNFSPTPNWNIRINGSKGASKETNIGAEWFDWLDQRLPVWESVVATNGELDSGGNPVTWNTAPFNDDNPTGQSLAQYYQSQVVGNALAFISAVDGRSNPSVRSARVNGIVNYRFTEGRLKGFNVGGALRYRGAPVIGYGLKVNDEGTTVLDLDTVYKGKEEIYVDFMAGYRGRMEAFGGFNYRLQLNIRNLLNDDDPVPMQALTTGTISRLVTVDPRLTSITFAVDF